MITALRNWVCTQQFTPGAFAPFVNPFYLARRGLWKAIRSNAGAIRGAVLDVGCGTKPYRALFDVSEYVGMDIDNEMTRQRASADVLYDGTRFPFEDGRFDAVLCNQVLEHIFTPDTFVAEIRRVLAPGGCLLLTVPFVWDEHEQPWDYARYSSFGLRSLLERHGFKVLRQEKLLADASVLFQMLNAYLFKVTRARSPFFNLLLIPVLMAPVSLLGWLAGVVLPRNPDLFLDQVVVAERTG
jgi:SAM-dependent methyltransferase